VRGRRGRASQRRYVTLSTIDSNHMIKTHRHLATSTYFHAVQTLLLQHSGPSKARPSIFNLSILSRVCLRASLRHKGGDQETLGDELDVTLSAASWSADPTFDELATCCLRLAWFLVVIAMGWAFCLWRAWMHIVKDEMAYEAGMGIFMTYSQLLKCHYLEVAIAALSSSNLHEVCCTTWPR
jgi:hypothetical protein